MGKGNCISYAVVIKEENVNNITGFYVFCLNSLSIGYYYKYRFEKYE